MDQTIVDTALEDLTNLAIDLGSKALGALALWVIGRVLIGWAVRMLKSTLRRQKVDPTFIRYMGSTISALLNILLAIAVLGVFGVETTTFAGVLAAAGLAIGMAWSGLLSNFAAGAFMVLLRPFKVGDLISAGGVTGTVQEIGLFATSLDTPENIRTYVGNAKLFGDNIMNYSHNAHRRVEVRAQIGHGVDPKQAMVDLKARVEAIDNVLEEPPAEVVIVDLALAGPVLAVRPYCHNDNYWQVFFDSTRMIDEAFSAADYPVPAMHQEVRHVS